MKSNTTITDPTASDFGNEMYPTATLRWSKAGVLEQLWGSFDGKQKWMSVAVEQMEEGCVE